jgi:hypothetical protein
MVKNCHYIDFKRVRGDVGALTAIEGSGDAPFEIRRVYYITGVPEGVTRGFHSHRELEQVLLCQNGRVKIRIKTPFEEEIIPLQEDSKGLYIGHMSGGDVRFYSGRADGASIGALYRRGLYP